ncbi:hypothetical protein N480_19710 [Pseudoalteromonas luteoviolacea S2607]|uniref:nuclear transport factor 2 family protein n=1 Tax=Pseudoalteromonas luteoviolacea TaxID=43657 RepID=UPI0007B06A6E|nr:nuclear transport factor 2 family protein [Pseudoalteromonas luteoviolacea]KZN35273.1 hypothetical protein N480_19710 [Pseudoalteromonas luteoviolacea S2607]
MYRKLILATGLTLLSSTVFSVSAQEFTTPQAAVNSYIKGVSEGVGKRVEAAFQETATIQFFDRRNMFHNYDRNQFVKMVDTGNKWNAKIEITQLLRTKNAANATVEFTWGENKQHGYVDYLNLIFDGKKWQITSKVAQYVERESVKNGAVE